MTETKPDVEKFIAEEISEYLTGNNKHDLINLLKKVEDGEVHTIKINRPLVENRFINIMIFKFMKDHDVDLIMNYTEKPTEGMGNNKTS